MFSLTNILKSFKSPRWSVEQVYEMAAEGKLEQASLAADKLLANTPDRDLITKCIKGHLHFLSQQDQQAEEVFRSVLRDAPGFAYAHYGLSLIFAEQNKPTAALDHALFASNVAANDPRILAQLGYCYMLLNAYGAAEQHLQQAIKLAPKDKHSWNNLAIVSRLKGDPLNAKVCWLQALHIDPGYGQALDNLAHLDEELRQADMRIDVGMAPVPANLTQVKPEAIPWTDIQNLYASGQSDQALNLAEAAWPPDPTLDDVRQLSSLYKKKADHDSAFQILQDYAERHPEEAEIWASIGESLLGMNDIKTAIDALRKAIELGDNSCIVHANLGSALHANQQYAEGLTEMRQAAALEPSSVALQKRLAAALIMCCEYEEAEQIYRSQLAAGQVQINEVQGNLAVALVYLGKFDEALEHLDHIISTQSHDPALRFMRGLVHLLHEHWEAGWTDYTWRSTSNSKQFRMLPFDKWNGEPLAGKTIVVLAEQGLGDQIMFASCLPDLLKLNPHKVYIEASYRVSTILQRSFPECDFISTRQKKDLEWVRNLGHVDCFTPLGDLPFHFRKRAQDFPGKPFLCANPQRVEHWRARLREHGAGPYIGFSWKGGTELTRSPVRSMSIDMFKPLMQARSAQWVCLQYGEIQDTLATFKAPGQPVAYWPEAIADLDEFGALLSALDLVVTVCNTTVHFAGGLGIPTAVLAPHIPEWRYGVAFKTMPWYASVNVYRQTQPDNWSAVLETAAQAVMACHDNNQDENYCHCPGAVTSEINKI